MIDFTKPIEDSEGNPLWYGGYTQVSPSDIKQHRIHLKDDACLAFIINEHPDGTLTRGFLACWGVHNVPDEVVKYVAVYPETANLGLTHFDTLDGLRAALPSAAQAVKITRRGHRLISTEILEIP